MSTAIRAVQLSGDPCALAGLRNGEIAWMFPSGRLIEAGCYPKKGALRSAFGTERWRAFLAGDTSRASKDGLLRNWIQSFGDKEEQFDGVYVTEECLPVQSMDTLVVLLTMDDNDLFPEDGDDEDEMD
jgi:hypothetical protein